MDASLSTESTAAQLKQFTNHYVAHLCYAMIEKWGGHSTLYNNLGAFLVGFVTWSEVVLWVDKGPEPKGHCLLLPLIIGSSDAA